MLNIHNIHSPSKITKQLIGLFFKKKVPNSSFGNQSKKKRGVGAASGDLVHYSIWEQTGRQQSFSDLVSDNSHLPAPFYLQPKESKLRTKNLEIPLQSST